MYFTPAETWRVCVVLFIARLSLRCALLSLASQSYPLSAPSPFHSHFINPQHSCACLVVDLHFFCTADVIAASQAHTINGGAQATRQTSLSSRS